MSVQVFGLTFEFRWLNLVQNHFHVVLLFVEIINTFLNYFVLPTCLHPHVPLKLLIWCFWGELFVSFALLAWLFIKLSLPTLGNNFQSDVKIRKNRKSSRKSLSFSTIYFNIINHMQSKEVDELEQDVSCFRNFSI